MTRVTTRDRAVAWQEGYVAGIGAPPMANNPYGAVTREELNAGLPPPNGGETLPAVRSHQVSVKCPACRETRSVLVPTDAYRRWLGGGMSIRDLMPNLSASDREGLQTGYCDPCWEKDLGPSEPWEDRLPRDPVTQTTPDEPFSPDPFCNS